MFNLLLMIVSIILCFGIEVLVARFFKKEGLFVWIAVASILANILVCKTINLLGFASALGNIMFASNFLATDIITTKYGAKESKKAVKLGLVSVLCFILTTQIAICFIPDSSDIANESMKTLFSLSLRTSIVSVSMYFISNLLNIYIFEKIREKIPGKLWLRSNVSTIIANCSENYIFAFGAFLGILDVPTILSIATVGTIIEIILSVCDTPFLYLATAKPKSNVSHNIFTKIFS